MIIFRKHNIVIALGKLSYKFLHIYIYRKRSWWLVSFTLTIKTGFCSHHFPIHYLIILAHTPIKYQRKENMSSQSAALFLINPSLKAPQTPEFASAVKYAAVMFISCCKIFKDIIFILTSKFYELKLEEMLVV